MSPERVASPGSILFSHHSISLEKNAVLEIRVTGEWSPTCAIRRSGRVKNPEDIRVGPEGFRVHISDGNVVVSGKDERNSKIKFETESTTKSFTFDPLRAVSVMVGPVSISSPVSLSLSSQSTTGTSESSEKSQYQQTSKVKSSTADFQSGLRLPHAPFPGLPAGAYIAVVVSEEGSVREIVDTFVVQGQRTFVAPQKSKIYFVVNDCQDERSYGSLSVHLQAYAPTGPIVEQLIDTMQASLQIFSKEGEKLVNEGGELGSRIETLKGSVIEKLERSSLGYVMSDPTLRSVFLHWIQQESDKIVRRARVRDLARQIQVAQFEITDLGRYLELSDKQENYLAMRMGGLIKEANLVPLFDSQFELVEYATKFFLPLFQLYYSDVVGPIKRRLSYQQFDLELAGKEVVLLAEQLRDGVEKRGTSATTHTQVIVRIPRPGVQLSKSDRKLTPTLDEGRSKVFWDHLFRNSSNPEGWGVHLAYGDLYQDAAQTKLSTTQEAPIIMAMALALGVKGSSRAEHLTNLLGGSSVGMEVDQELGFPLVQGPKFLLLTNEDLRNYEVGAGFVKSDRLVNGALQYLQSEPVMGLNSGKGLSPFAAFTFGRHSRGSIVGLQEALALDSDGYPGNLTDVLIVFKLASTNRKAMTWLKN